MSEKQKTPFPKGKVYVYNGRGADEVLDKPATRVSMADLRYRILYDVVAQDVGAMGIQTKAEDGQRKWYFFDTDNIVESSCPESLTPLRDYDLNNPKYDITIGEPWDSPLGKTDTVTGIAMPYTDAIYSHAVTTMTGDVISPTAHGRNVIDVALGLLPRNPDIT